MQHEQTKKTNTCSLLSDKPSSVKPVSLTELTPSSACLDSSVLFIFVIVLIVIPIYSSHVCCQRSTGAACVVLEKNPPVFVVVVGFNP